MANINRTDPYQYLAHFDPLRDLDNPPSWGRLRRFFNEFTAEPTIKVDVSEDDKAYIVKAEIPGVKKEDIDVSVEGNQVSISAQVKREKEEKKGETVVHSERYYGRQSRVFTLGREVDRKAVQAKYEDGVLELTLPKNGAAKGERIAIQ
jgi:HSP20 family protein